MNRKARTLYHNKTPLKLHRRHCLFNFSEAVLNYMAMKIIKMTNVDNTPIWDGIKRQSGCYVTFYEKYLYFEKKVSK